MIDKEKILQLISSNLEEKGYFLVELSISTNNRIYIEVDADTGVPISYCVQLSRIVEASLDREGIDFELEVTSATLGQPFKVHRQYLKNVGKEVSVITSDGSKSEGILSSVTEENITLTSKQKIKVEGEKKKREQIVDIIYPFSQIKETKNIIRFK